MTSIRKYGDPPYKIAVIHGGPGASGEMKPVAQHLCSDYGILEPLQKARSVEKQIDELKVDLLSAGESRFTLIGFSWGAWLSLLTAVYHPSIIEKIIIIGCGPFEQKYVQEISKTRLTRLNPSEKKEFKSILEDFNNFDNENSKLLLQKLKSLTDKTDQYNPIKTQLENINFNIKIFQKVWKEAAALRKAGKLLKLIQTISCPVVAIHGTYDPHPIEGVKAPLSPHLNNFRFIELKNCGHKPWLEKEAKNDFYNILHSELQ
jgi:pimeloyl-ACP methyl ester carboxylesterase